MAKVELTTMCMILDRDTNKVLVQNRKKSWKGISFPGGHVEVGESLHDATIREIKEETGLTISDLQVCGVVHWCNDKTGDRYFVFNFRTETYSGEIISETEEGDVFWVDINELSALGLAGGFGERLPMFFEGRYSEGFAVWNEENKHSPLKWF